jgi:hypothetical protein
MVIHLAGLEAHTKEGKGAAKQTRVPSARRLRGTLRIELKLARHWKQGAFRLFSGISPLAVNRWVEGSNPFRGALNCPTRRRWRVGRFHAFQGHGGQVISE